MVGGLDKRPPGSAAVTLAQSAKPVSVRSRACYFADGSAEPSPCMAATEQEHLQSAANLARLGKKHDPIVAMKLPAVRHGFHATSRAGGAPLEADDRLIVHRLA